MRLIDKNVGIKAARGLAIILMVSLLGACANAPVPVSPPTVEESPGNRVRQLLATAYNSMTKRDQAAAEAALLEARRLDPKNPWIALNLGVINQQRGRSDLARIEYQAALAADSADNAAVVSNGSLGGAGVGKIARHNLALLDKGEGRKATSLEPVKQFSALQARAEDKTPLAIGESKQGETRSELLALLEIWRTSWKGGDVDAYFANYARNFRGDKVDRLAWEENRLRLIGGKRGIDLHLENIDLLIEGNKATFTFIQRYRSPVFSDVGTKQLGFERIGGKWLITREVFTAQK